MLLGLGVVTTVAVIGVLAAAGYVLAIAASAPDLSELKPADKGQLSVVYAVDGTRLGFIQSDVLRRVVPWKDIPVDMRRATVAIEDERFYKHDGVDLNAIVRAGIKNLESGKTVQGGSTITQQLVRALYIKDPKRDFARKIREAKLASELEDEHSKTWILHNYLNTVPYGTVGGRTAIGIEAAAVTFFDKHAKNLTLDEAALLAGLPQAPSQYNPFRNPEAAISRRNEVLRQMASNRYITQSEAAEAIDAPLKLKRGTRYITRREPYFFDFVQEQLIERYGIGIVRAGGLRIHTTIRPAVQDLARQAITGQLYDPADPSGALVSIDPSNGYIRAMAASGTYQTRNFNLAAEGHRQPGSAFKTMVLTAAIRAGVDPDRTTYVSKPLHINDPEAGVLDWEVSTYSHSYNGTMTLRSATLASDNTVYAQLILDIGPKKVCETARDLGITTKLDCYPAEGLGGLRLGVSPLEMANAYATLASGGMRNEPKAIKRVVFPDGKSEDLGKPKRTRVLTDGQAYEVTQILEANVLGGTGTEAQIGCPAAGQDRHDRRVQRRLVRGIHAAPVHGGVGRLPGCPGLDGGHAHRLRRRRHLAGDDLARLHDHREGRQLRRLPAAHRAGGVLALLRQVRLDRLGGDRRVLHAGHRRDDDRRGEVRPALLRGGPARHARGGAAGGGGRSRARAARERERERERQRERHGRAGRGRRARLTPWPSSS